MYTHTCKELSSVTVGPKSVGEAPGKARNSQMEK